MSIHGRLAATAHYTYVAGYIWIDLSIRTRPFSSYEPFSVSTVLCLYRNQDRTRPRKIVFLRATSSEIKLVLLSAFFFFFYFSLPPFFLFSILVSPLLSSMLLPYRFTCRERTGAHVSLLFRNEKSSNNLRDA